MKIVHTPEEMTIWSNAMRREGKRISLVPTMGCLHAGHLSLIKKAKDLSELVIVSIFVNPMQFGPGEDLDAYPRQFEIDCGLAEQQGADIIFSPAPEKMYDDTFQTSISVGRLSRGLCGADRPGHFEGVATVVTKLFNITSPHVAVFGEKDFQQLAIIRQLVKDLNIPVEIIAGPIVREADGLAMSSRNKYLEGNDRQIALCLSQAIAEARKLIAGSTEPVLVSSVLTVVKSIVADAGAVLEYAEIIDKVTLATEEYVSAESVLAVAAKIGGRVRLIDNSILI
ncbi:pantoate--beta-alanine ligase [Desulforhopalus sp. IMCC35007]|uniref:pantoate--beta-alanine ligase n=1 Tax=Desulforhopalus sp. IMCC35007 TaxID=2569543 RepID=UPI0010ADE4E2|nr:pantoate--beta-alanine ligase [Desulforhopalus sp. IMCC35007]TKB11098.1 pantoate--beta-alanine ligase [Desulforhopalus sp. IMCC35007]